MHGERCARRPPHAVPNPCSNLELEPRTPLSRNRLENQLLTMRGCTMEMEIAPGAFYF